MLLYNREAAAERLQLLRRTRSRDYTKTCICPDLIRITSDNIRTRVNDRFLLYATSVYPSARAARFARCACRALLCCLCCCSGACSCACFGACFGGFIVRQCAYPCRPAYMCNDPYARIIIGRNAAGLHPPAHTIADACDIQRRCNRYACKANNIYICNGYKTHFFYFFLLFSFFCLFILKHEIEDRRGDTRGDHRRGGGFSRLLYLHHPHRHPHLVKK